MLEGLEIKEVMFSIPKNSEILRLESDFYTAKSFDINKFVRGADIIDFVQYGTSKELNEESRGFPILRLNEFDSHFIGQPAKYCDNINKEVFESLLLKKNDVLICRTNGNPKLVGKSAIVSKDLNIGYASYLFKIRPKKQIINSATLVAYLNSKFGRIEIEKYSMTSNQSNFSPAKFREIRIPTFSKQINSIIEDSYLKSYDLHNESKSRYTLAESVILADLGLKDFKPSKDSINIKNFKDSFLKTGRLDSDYYQKKYDDYLNIITNYSNGYELLKNVCDLKDSNYNVNENQIYTYIELSNIGKTGEIFGCENLLGSKLPSRARRKVKSADVIISSIEGSLQSCAIINKAFDNALCSTGFYVINSMLINSATLLVFFKSEPMQNILKQNCSGTILCAINKGEFLNLPIPLIKKQIQIKISELVEESFHLKTESERLLEISKKAVEIAIETSEETALKFILGHI